MTIDGTDTKSIPFTLTVAFGVPVGSGVGERDGVGRGVSVGGGVCVGNGDAVGERDGDRDGLIVVRSGVRGGIVFTGVEGAGVSGGVSIGERSGVYVLHLCTYVISVINMGLGFLTLNSLLTPLTAPADSCVISHTQFCRMTL